MNILILQETDWLTRGPHTQHHIFERLSRNPSIRVFVFDYDIDKIQKSNSLIIPKKIYRNVYRAIKNSNVTIIRTAHLHIPYFRRISSLITNLFQLLKIIRTNKPDLIVAYAMTNGFVGLLISKLFNIPFVYFYIDILHKLVPISKVVFLARIVSRICLKYANLILVHTKLQRNYVINEGALPQKVKISPDGISLDNTIVDKNKLNVLKSQLSILDDDFIIFFMGYLYDFAGLMEIIDYYNDDVKNGKYPLRFLIMGDGGVYNDLRNYIKEMEANWVYLLGHIPFFDITEYIHLADLCLLSFDINDITKEILPIKIFEYMAMKKPVLSNSLPGVMLEVGKGNGVIFSKNQEDLIKKIGLFIHDKDKLKEIGQKGYELVKEKYVWSKIVKNFKEITFDLISKKRKAYQK